MSYTVTMKRGPKPDLVRTRDTWGQALDCALSLAELHGLKSKDVFDVEGGFKLDASAYYEGDQATLRR